MPASLFGFQFDWANMRSLSRGDSAKRLLYVCPDFGGVSETFVEDLIRGLVPYGWEVLVCCQKNHLLGRQQCDFEVREVPFMVERSFLRRVFNGLMKMLSGNFGTAGVWETRCENANNRLSVVVSEFQPAVAYVEFGGTGVLAVEAMSAANVPFVVHFHGNDISGMLSDGDYRLRLREVFSRAARLIAASNHMRRLIVLEGAVEQKCCVVKLDVNVECCEPVSWDVRRRESPSIVFLGRLTPKKHPVALIEAFAIVRRSVPRAVLTIIGDGPEKDRVESRIRLHGLSDSVRMLGAMPRGKALLEVAKHWVYAQHSVTAPSGDQEGFALSLAEAALLELPVVSTNHNGIPEHVIHGLTGLLCKEFDYETMAAYLVRLLSNPDECKLMGEAGRLNVATNFPRGQRPKAISELLEQIGKAV